MAVADNEAVLHGTEEHGLLSCRVELIGLWMYFVRATEDLGSVCLSFLRFMIHLSMDEYRQGKLNPLPKPFINPFVLL
ncbi:hypothetical protein C5167_007599 [Papaver somniferum]|nr:hypothetical protein C5167_007599 [Papaver somniferum]